MLTIAYFIFLHSAFTTSACASAQHKFTIRVNNKCKHKNRHSQKIASLSRASALVSE